MIGHATNIITGLAISLQATALRVAVIAAGICIAYSVGGELYVGALAAAVMLTMDSIVVAVNFYDPFTDNTGGIAGMAELAHEVRTIADALDAVLVGVVAVRVGVVMVILVHLLLVPVVFFALPLAVIGAFVAVASNGHALDLSALIGLLMLIAIGHGRARGGPGC